MADDRWSVKVSDDKYEYVYEKGRTFALRNGEAWRDLTGDNLIYFLAAELKDAREKIAALENHITELNDSADMAAEMLAGEDN